MKQLRVAGIRARELEGRLADREARLDKLRAEVRCRTPDQGPSCPHAPSMH